MIVKTQDLDGIALDWAVAQSEQIETCGPQDFREQRKHRVQCGEFVYRWHQSWMQAGEIIERERINVTYSDDHKRWEACYTVDGNPIHRFDGATPLVAVMRTYVGFTLGGAVEIPEELTC